MQTAFLDSHEKQYLQDCRRPRLTWLQTFFWFFLPAIGTASVAVQWTRGIDAISAVLTGGVFLTLSLMYFPLVSIVFRPSSYRVVKWSGIARIKPASTGRGREDYVGETRILLPVGWEEHFRALSGREVRARGVVAGNRAAPAVQVLALNNEYSVNREVPLGLGKIDPAHFYFGLAVVPVAVMLGVAMKTRFYLVYLLYFGLVSVGFALYGMHVARRNQAILREIAGLHGEQVEAGKVSHRGASPAN